MISTDPWIWISALMALSCFSLLYGDNKLFRLAENTYTATVVGHSVVTAWMTLRDRFYPLFYQGKLLLIIPLVLGLLVPFVVWRKYAWIATISMSVMIGVSTGVVLRGLIATDVIANVRAVIAETAQVISAPPTTQLGYLIRIVFTICALCYFLFTLMPKGAAGKPFQVVMTVGKYALIIYMGISLGNSMQQFVGTATSAIYRLTGLWLGLG